MASRARSPLEKALDKAIKDGQDVEASWTAGKLDSFKHSESGTRGIRHWTVVTMEDGELEMTDDIDTSDM